MVKVVRAVNLAPHEPEEFIAAAVRLLYGSEKQETGAATRVCLPCVPSPARAAASRNGTYNPVWDETLAFDMKSDSATSLSISVWSGEIFLGQVRSTHAFQVPRSTHTHPHPC